MKISSILSLGAIPAISLGAIASNAQTLEISQYTQDQVVSISQFSDVKPGDWAYQALANVVERYGCVAGYPNGTFQGGHSLSRYEAAALLNACLDRVTEATDEVRRLQNEFSKELAVITARVSTLENKVGELEATQFSTTTKLRGEASFILGGVPGLNTNSGVQVGNTAFNYDVRLNLDTSFNGKDLLRTRLRSGNFSADPFGSSSSLFKLDKAEVANDQLNVDRLYYQNSFGNVTLTAGALVRNTEMAFIPTAYKSEILDFFTTAGAPGVYNKATGAGAGAQYSSNGVVLGINYVAQDGSDSSTGVFNERGALNAMAQAGYKANNWGIAAGYRYGTEGTRVRTYNGFDGANGTLAANQTSNGYSVNAYWQPSQSGIIPAISAGYGYNQVSGAAGASNATDSNSWFTGLQWSDVFARGNSAGFAIGQAPSAEYPGVSNSTLLEIFYKMQVSDNISVTPAIFRASDNQRYQDSSKWGGVVQTKFTF